MGLMLPAYDVALIGNVKIFTSDFDWCEKKKKKKKKNHGRYLCACWQKRVDHQT